MKKTTRVRDIGRAIRARRLQLGWSQAELAERSRTTRKWIGEVEHGKATAEIGLVLSALEALGIRVRLEAPGSKTEAIRTLSLEVVPPSAAVLADVLSHHVVGDPKRVRPVSFLKPRG
ncbi:MAG: helix-turn-helix domain-containing protein [Gemmatimonadota bacterium]